MTLPAPGDSPGKAAMRKAGIAVAICLSALLALLPAQASAAQDQSDSPSPETLWKEYPLAPTAEPSARPEATTTSVADSRASPKPVAASSDGGAPVIVLVLLGLIGAGGTLTLVSLSRRREREADAAPTPPPPVAVTVPVGDAAPALWHGRSGRFSRAVTRTTATIAATQERGGGDSPAAGDPHQPRAGEGARDEPPRRTGAPAPAEGRPSPVTPVATSASAGSPPDHRLAWTAEIEWRELEGESRFFVVARGAGTVVVAQSDPLEWPPSGPAAVQAVSNAADALADTLVAAGWKTLPPGQAWYAKRFAWEPGTKPADVKRAGAKSPKPIKPVAAGPKPFTAPKPATSPPARVKADARDRVPAWRRRWKLLLAVLCVQAVLAVLVALQIGGGNDGSSGGQSTPSPTTQAGEPKAKASDGTDLTIPLLLLLGVPVVILIVRHTRRTSR